MKRAIIFKSVVVGIFTFAVSSFAFAQTPYVPPSQTAGSPSTASSAPAPAPTPAPAATPAPTPAPAPVAATPAPAAATPYTPPSATADSSTGGLQSQIDELKTRVDSLQTTGETKQPLAGYNGGFFMQSQDEKFSLMINLSLSTVLEAQVIEAGADAYTGNFSSSMVMSGTAFDPKLSYSVVLVLGTKQAKLFVAELGYTWKDQLNFHAGVIGLNSMIPDWTAPQFLGGDLGSNRYSLGAPSIGAYFDGVFWKKLKYVATIANSADVTGLNANQELAYALELTFGDLDGFGGTQNDYSKHDKPTYVLDAGAGFYHLDSNPQARVMHGNVGAAFKWKGFNVLAQTYLRLSDQDQFTVQQMDAAYLFQVGYFIIPQKFEIAVRTSGLLDDLNEAGLNLNMQGGDAFLGGYGGSSILSDADGDSDNEYDYSVAMNYYIYKTKVKLLTMYSYVIDGKPGPSDPVYQAIIAKLAIGF